MDSTLACLAEWMPRQRWYAAKARIPRLRLVAQWALPSDDPDASVRTLLVADDGPDRSILYQVPLVERGAADGAVVIGTTPSGSVLVDGPHDPAYARALLRQAGLDGDRGEAHVLSGEQSNTSVIFAGVDDDRPPIICKVFRQVHAGLNPDIELQTALAAAGSHFIPRVFGSVEGSWPVGDMERTGSLAFAQEFLPGVEDAWRVALRAAAAGEEFTALARDLGHATAHVHADLARLFPVVEAGVGERTAIAEAWHRRLAIAVAEIPALTPLASAVAAVYARAADAPWPALQRVHGDYHLGQVLRAPQRGWVLVDFEGEPMRPMAERRLPDLAPRDVAGMLRSFDYVAGSIPRDLAHDAERVQAWSRAARAAFLEGYEATSRRTQAGALLDALELDKAVYEAIYETRNRPDWVTIPLRAVERLATG